jgi:glycosyltransferase involved in cell wall biosynthesis
MSQVDSNIVPTVSIFMPVYNSEKYLAQTLDSLRTQTFQDFEIIIADDGSTDQSLALAQSYARRD